tara:strand:+ start:1197 stop:1928 length:732 start_codon:yes stop_codon:yes gene_type:complete
MERYNNILDRQISKLNNIFELDNIPNNAIVKVDNPGAGECLYTAITNYLRIEFIMKKYIYKLEKNKVSNMLYLPQLISKSSKINNGEDTIQTLGRELRKMVCDWLEINGDLDYYETGKTLKQYLLDEDAIGDKVENSFLGNFLTKKEMKPELIEDNYKKYIRYMRKNTSYGGPIEIFAIANVLGRNIKAYKQLHDTYNFTGQAAILGENEQPIIGIYHTMGGNHWKTLYPKKINSIDIVGMLA